MVTFFLGIWDILNIFSVSWILLRFGSGGIKIESLSLTFEVNINSNDNCFQMRFCFKTGFRIKWILEKVHKEWHRSIQVKQNSKFVLLLLSASTVLAILHLVLVSIMSEVLKTEFWQLQHSTYFQNCNWYTRYLQETGTLQQQIRAWGLQHLRLNRQEKSLKRGTQEISPLSWT